MVYCDVFLLLLNIMRMGGLISHLFFGAITILRGKVAFEQSQISRMATILKMLYWSGISICKNTEAKEYR